MSVRTERRELLNAREAANELNISERKTRELLATGELRSIRIGSRRLIPRKAIEDFIARRMEAADDAT